MWFGLATIYQMAYYFASHNGQLPKVLLTLPVTRDCVKKIRHITIGITAYTWAMLVTNIGVTVCLFFVTDGQYDFALAQFVAYIKVPENKIVLARCVGALLYFWPIPCCVFSQVIVLVLVYVFYHQFQQLEQNFRLAIGMGGQFGGNFSIFRRRHQTLSLVVNDVDGFMKFVNVAGFLCHVVVIIVHLYNILFYPDSMATPTSAFINVAILFANVTNLTETASAGIIVNHMVCERFCLSW